MPKTDMFHISQQPSPLATRAERFPPLHLRHHLLCIKMRTTILVVPALLTPLATAQPPDKTCEHSSSAPADGEVKVRNDELADAFQAKKEFAGAVAYVASDYIVCNPSFLRSYCCLGRSC
jgi:hypothetical protein